MMYGVVKRNGVVVGQHAIDPTAPGGLEGQMAKIAAAQGATRDHRSAPVPPPITSQGVRRAPAPAPAPASAMPALRPVTLPPQAQPLAALRVPMPGVAPMQVFLRFNLRMADGNVRQVTRAVQIDPRMGVPPGVYQLTGGQS